MFTDKRCATCAWYCHADGRCYGGYGDNSAVTYIAIPEAMECDNWTFDGLEDWERDTLVTMDEVEA